MPTWHPALVSHCDKKSEKHIANHVAESCKPTEDFQGSETSSEVLKSVDVHIDAVIEENGTADCNVKTIDRRMLRRQGVEHLGTIVVVDRSQSTVFVPRESAS